MYLLRILHVCMCMYTYVITLQVSHDQDDNYTMPGNIDRAKAESAGQVGIARVRTLINQGVSPFLFLWSLNQELPVLGIPLGELLNRCVECGLR